METRAPTASPQGLASQDDNGLWMKMDSDPMADHSEMMRLISSSVTSGEGTQDETEITPTAPAGIRRYYSVMDDEGADYVFIPPLPPGLPPTHMAPLLPAEGYLGGTGSNSSVTLINGAGDATEAKANPRSLHWHHGEGLMAALNEEDKVIAGAAQTPPPTHQEQISREGAGSLMDPSAGMLQDIATGQDQSQLDTVDFVMLSEGKENWGEPDVDRDKYPKRKEITENSSNEANFNTRMEKTGGFHEVDLVESHGLLENKKMTENDTYAGAETNASTPVTKTDAGTSQLPEETSDNEEHVDTRSLTYKVTTSMRVRRDSGSNEVPTVSMGEGLAKENLTESSSDERQEMLGREKQGDGSYIIATDIQQGEVLLQRLQLVQQRQDVHLSETSCASQEVLQEKRDEERDLEYLSARGGDLTNEDKEEEWCDTVKDERTKTNRMGRGENDRNEINEEENKERRSSSMMPSEPEPHQNTEADSPDDDPGHSCAEWHSVNTHETCTFQSSFHRFSAAETSVDKQIHEAAQGKQNLQRAGGVFNLADPPDVLEFPFKTNILLEPLPIKVGQGERDDWQFSEQKMQKEISQEIQRELVLVNQGKIPGGYSKGEARQLKQTKLLFEAFHQDNTEGPTRHKKPPSTLMKGHIYPSVLERTRSLEMFSVSSYPISRAQSLRLYQTTTTERAKSPENLRLKSPTGDSKTRLSPYPKYDTHPRMYRSMDSISTDASMSAVDMWGKTKERNRNQESAILKQNPFFKLRPALALQPEVERDIREAKEREEELRRQRYTLYGDNHQSGGEDEKSPITSRAGAKQQSRGKLERVWPPPSKKEQIKSEQTQQEAKVHRAVGHKAPLWQRWESGQINGQPSKEKN